MAVVLIVCAFLVLSGSQVGRCAGIVAGATGCIAIWWMPCYPIWSLTCIALGVLAIYTLAAYRGNAESCVERRRQYPPDVRVQTSEITPRWVRKPRLLERNLVTAPNTSEEQTMVIRHPWLGNRHGG